MTKFDLRVVGVAIAGVAVLVAIAFLALRKHLVDFTDNPALLVDVSTTGVVTLDSHDGKIVAPLDGVNWNSDPALLGEAQKLVREAQRDMVAFERSKDGKLEIWYPAESGAKCLNERLNDLFARPTPLRSQ